MYASTSCFVIRPPAPDPFTFDRSILFSRAILRTSGEIGPTGSAAAGADAGEAGGTAGPGAAPPAAGAVSSTCSAATVGWMISCDGVSGCGAAFGGAAADAGF